MVQPPDCDVIKFFQLWRMVKAVIVERIKECFFIGQAVDALRLP